MRNELVSREDALALVRDGDTIATSAIEEAAVDSHAQRVRSLMDGFYTRASRYSATV